jgi:hypothetical protein
MDCEGAMRTDADGGAVLWLAPLGVPLRIELQRAEDLAAVSSACREWAGQPGRCEAPLVLTLARNARLSGTDAPEFEVTGKLLSLAGPGVLGKACAERGEARCTVSSDWLEALAKLRSDVLEPLILFMATRRGRVPLHASAILSGDLAILLAGPSGAGKSSLALAADRAGWTVLTEDTAYVQLEPELKISGWPGPVHLLSCGRSAGHELRWRGGKLKAAIPLARRPAKELSASRATLCVLTRARGETVALDRLSRGEALRLMGPLEPGFDLLADEIHEARRALLRDGAWRLTLSSDPDQAIALLAANLPRL